MKFIQRLIVFAFLLGTSGTLLRAQVTDFNVTVLGPRNVVAGHNLYLAISPSNIVGTDNQEVTPTITGLPADVTAHWLTMETYCCGDKLYNLGGGVNSLRLTASAAAAPGTYNLVVTVKTDGGVSRSATMALTVWSAFPTVPQATSYPADTPLATLSAWESLMVSLGNQFCFDSSMEDETHTWFYDGLRNYHQIEDYTHSPAWDSCIAVQRGAYAPFVINHQGNIQGYLVFPEGLTLDYQKTGDTTSREAALWLFDGGLYTHPKPNTSVIGGAVTWDYSREVSFAVNTHLAHERLGYPRDPDFEPLIEQLIGHFDQWFISKSAGYVQPFMVGLAAEALIAYNDATPDPRVPYLLKLAGDYLRQNSWDSGVQGFPYQIGDGTSVPLTDENLVIVPLYGWLYRYTGDVNYRNWGDEAFNGGVRTGWLGTGKFFSMSYRWSGKYVEWRQAPTSAGVPPPVAPPSGSTSSTATFLRTDTTTQGNWRGKYGTEGYSLAGIATSNPSYVTPSTDGSLYTWAAATSDVRALQNVAGTSRVAACWYSNSAFTIDLPFTDQATHEVGIYADDWDGDGPRVERIDILDASGNVLDTHTISNFTGGQYLLWNLGGHVKIKVTTLTGNAVVGGIFFGEAGTSSTSAATFLRTDATTQGNWRGKYGTEGYSLSNIGTSNPSYVTPTTDGATYTWASDTSDVRALQNVAGTSRVAACWYSFSAFTIDLPFTDQATHEVGIYADDWDSSGPRVERIDVTDASGNVLDTHTISNFTGGQYLLWNLSGHVKIRITSLLTNAVVGGIFFGEAGSSSTSTATFLRTDTTTQGNWRGKYGTEGYNIAAVGTSNPSYVTPTTDGAAFTWTAATSDVRALQNVAGTSRVAACWYSFSAFTIDLPFTDQATHEVGIYADDWDGDGPRVERIDVLDASGNVLDTRTISNFTGGQYLIWNMSGHTKIRITSLLTNAVVGGIFFGEAGSSSSF